MGINGAEIMLSNIGQILTMVVIGKLEINDLKKQSITPIYACSITQLYSYVHSLAFVDKTIMIEVNLFVQQFQRTKLTLPYFKKLFVLHSLHEQKKTYLEHQLRYTLRREVVQASSPF